jgi:hypothetical protein
MIVVPFEAGHLKQLGIQQSQEVFKSMMLKDEYGISLEKGGPAFSAFVDGEIIAALGVIPQWENRAMAWGLIGGNARRHFVPLTKAIMRFLEVTPHRRVETSVDSDFAEGHRWARLLGFENEGRMRAYTPDGRDCNLYARVK